MSTPWRDVTVLYARMTQRAQLKPEMQSCLKG